MTCKLLPFLEHEDRVIKGTDGELYFCRYRPVYGPNGGGKSNVLGSIA
ncbi:MAG: hypothetical protein ACLU6Y_18940 [Ruminococcus sp.]